jgi:hypothetical protein
MICGLSLTDKHLLGLVEGAKNTLSALIDNLIAPSSTPSYADQRAFEGVRSWRQNKSQI